MVNTAPELQYAIWLADSLIRKAKVDDDGVFWITGTEVKCCHEGISQGVSGIALFLLELYRATGNSEYLSIVDSGMGWAEKRTRQKSGDFSMYTGRGGVVYTLLMLYEITGQEKYLTRAESLSSEVDFMLLMEQTKEFNLFEGLAGSVLVLLHLHRYTNAKWIGSTVDVLVRHILSHSKMSKTGGIFWINEKRFNIITGLCGFAEGNSGIAYMLLELARYVRNPAFLWAAEQAFLYEDALFNKGKNNWPDARKPMINNLELVKQANRLQWGLSRAKLSQSGYSNGWVGGKTGIVISRLRKLERLSKVDHAVGNAILDLKSLTLGYNEKNNDTSFLEGIIGAGLLMLELYKKSDDDKFLESAKRLSGKLWQNFKANENPPWKDASFSVGIAGLAYYFLKLFQCQSDITNFSLGIIRPDIPDGFTFSNIECECASLSLEHVMETVLNGTYPRTLSLLKTAYNFKIGSHHEFGSARVLRNSMDEVLKAHDRDLLLMDCYQYENLVSNVDAFFIERVESFLRRYYDILRLKELISESSRETIIRKFKFVLTRNAVVHESKWGWSNSLQSVEEMLRLGSAEHFTLILPSEAAVMEYPLEKAQAFMLLKFGSKEKPIDVFHAICDDHDLISNQESIGLLTEMFFELVRIGALMPCHRILIG